MEREERLPEHRARVVIVSRRARGRLTGEDDASSATLSLVPRWSSRRAVDAATEALRKADGRPPASR